MKWWGLLKVIEVLLSTVGDIWSGIENYELYYKNWYV